MTANFQFIAAADLEYSPPEFLVDQLIETDTVGVLFGEPGCGKSFLAVDLALSVASGAGFHGHGVKPGPVFYIAGEGHNGLVRRFHAWALARDVPLDDVPLFKSNRAAAFLDAASVQAVMQAVNALAASHGAPRLVVIDTLARNFGAGDENSTQEMNTFVAAMDDLRANWPGCVILLVHHTGHSDKTRARGAMALKGAADFEFRLEKEAETLTLFNLKMKDAPLADDIYFRLEGVPLELGAQSACLSATDAPVKADRMTPTQKTALKSYMEAAYKSGMWKDGTFHGVDVEAWRSEFYARHTGDSLDAKRKAFLRVRSDMVDNGKMLVLDEVYLIRDADLQMEIFSKRDMRDKAGHSAKCPG